MTVLTVESVVEATIYLAGPINGVCDAEAFGWRDRFTDALPRVATLDPMRRDYRGKESMSVEDIVHGDLADIDASDVLFAFCWQPSYGTAMEIFYAYESDMYVVAVVPEDVPVSPWVAYHADVYRSLEDGIAAVVGWLDERA